MAEVGAGCGQLHPAGGWIEKEYQEGTGCKSCKHVAPGYSTGQQLTDEKYAEQNADGPEGVKQVHPGAGILGMQVFNQGGYQSLDQGIAKTNEQ